MELGGKQVPEEKFEFEGVHGDPMQDAKKVPAKAKAEKETPEEDAGECEQDEMKGKKSKALTAAFEAFKAKVLEPDADIQAAFNELGHGIEKSLAPEPKPLDPTDIAAIVKLAVAEAVAPLNMEIATLKAQYAKAPAGPVVPQPRSLRLQPQDLLQKSQAAPQRQLTQIEKIARASTGLSVD